MIRLRNEAPTLFDVALVEEAILLAPTDVTVLPGRVRLGLPIGAWLNAEQLSESNRGLSLHAEDRPKSRYYLIRLHVGLIDDPDDPIEAVRITVALAGEGTDRAIVRSMEPLQLSSAPSRVDETVLTADLKFVKGERRRQTEGTESLLIGLGEGTEVAEWNLRKVGDTPLEGTFALSLVAETASAEGLAFISVISSVRRHRLKLVRYRAQLPPELMVYKFGT